MRKKIEITCPTCRSRIVHSVPLLWKERLFKRFVPTQIFKCQPCGTRFALHDSPLSEKETRRMLLFTSLVLFSLTGVFLVFFTFSGNNASTHADTAEITVKETTGNKTIPPPPKSPPSPLPKKFVGNEVQADRLKENEENQENNHIIHMGKDRLFGVNWEFNGKGLKITRIGDGPFYRAGLRKGDILVKLDNEAVKNTRRLLKVRNEIISGRRGEALVEVHRGKKKITYKLIKK